MPEQRAQVKPNRFRLPDITVVAGPLPATPILHDPPFLALRFFRAAAACVTCGKERIDDYLALGVRYIWVVNPRTRRAFLYTSEGMKEAKDDLLRTWNPNIEVPVAALE